MGKLILYPELTSSLEMKEDMEFLQSSALVVNCRSDESVQPAALLLQERLLRSFVGAILHSDHRQSVLDEDPAIEPLLPIVVLPALGGIIVEEVLTIGFQSLKQFARVKRDRRIGMVPPVHPAPVSRSVPSAGELWHLESIRFSSVRNRWKGRGVRVGVVDTGIDMQHRSFHKSLRGFAAIDDRCRLDDKAQPNDAASHGTNVCGLIADDVVGIAPEAELWVAQALTTWCGGRPCANLTRVAVAIDWLLCKGAAIINLSLGRYGCDLELYDECRLARERGTLVVAAIGNIPGGTTSPGNYDHVVGVGALNQRDQPATFSSRKGAKPDLYAPGYAICSTSTGGTYARNLEGTSFASAIATGVAAVLLERGREAGHADRDLEAVLRSVTCPLGLRFGNARTIRL